MEIADLARIEVEPTVYEYEVDGGKATLTVVAAAEREEYHVNGSGRVTVRYPQVEIDLAVTLRGRAYVVNEVQAWFPDYPKQPARFASGHDRYTRGTQRVEGEDPYHYPKVSRDSPVYRKLHAYVVPLCARMHDEHPEWVRLSLYLLAVEKHNRQVLEYDNAIRRAREAVKDAAVYRPAVVALSDERFVVERKPRPDMPDTPWAVTYDGKPAGYAENESAAWAQAASWWSRVVDR